MKKQDTPPGMPGETQRAYQSDTRGAWSAWFSWVTTICNSVVDSGTTANRPVKYLWEGRSYFDTTLGKPIWYRGTGWVDASGSAV